LVRKSFSSMMSRDSASSSKSSLSYLGFDWVIGCWAWGWEPDIVRKLNIEGVGCSEVYLPKNPNADGIGGKYSPVLFCVPSNTCDFSASIILISFSLS
jgi:hypothetical protein